MVEMQAVSVALRKAETRFAVVEDETWYGSCCLAAIGRHRCQARCARVVPQAVVQDWESQKPARFVDVVAKTLDVRLVALVSYRSSSRSILLGRRGQDLVDTTSGLNCSQGSINFVTSKMRAVVYTVVVRPLHSCCGMTNAQVQKLGRVGGHTLEVHDVFALFYLDANFTGHCSSEASRSHVTCCLHATG